MVEAVVDPLADVRLEMPKFERKWAYYVLGSEGSGTHMLRNALVEAGCSWLQEHESYQEDYYFESMKSPMVLRRSLPHAYRWPPIYHDVMQLERAGFTTHLLVIIRDWFATAQSVVNREYQGTIEDCYKNQENLFQAVGDPMLSRIMLTYVTYADFCKNEGFRRRLFEERLQLPYPENFQIFYSGDQYYG